MWSSPATCPTTAGDVATVVERHQVAGREDGYSIEVFDMAGNTVKVLTLAESQLRRPTSQDLPSVRSQTWGIGAREGRWTSAQAGAPHTLPWRVKVFGVGTSDVEQAPPVRETKVDWTPHTLPWRDKVWHPRGQ